MAIVTADSFGLASDGSTDIRIAMGAAYDSCSPGDTFQLHANGLYLTTYNTPLLLNAPGVTFDGNGASLFRDTMRTTLKSKPTEDILQVWGNNITVQDLRIVGFRKDTYTGDKLTTVTGTPTVVSTAIELDAQNEEVRLPQAGLDWIGNPKTARNYETPFYFRQVDGLQRFEASLSGTGGANDALFCLYDDDTDALIHSQAFSPTTQATFTITFDPAPTYLGTRYRVTIKKVNAGGVLTVHSITPYGEAGYRRSDQAGFTGGNEFSDAIQVQGVTGTTIQDCEIEGPDGDGINCFTTDTDTTIRRVHVRGNGRQAYTLHRSVNLLVEDCTGREVGRSGVDYEPNNVAHIMSGTLMRRCDFLNVRNYGVGINHWAKNLNSVMEDITTTNCGMGGMYGGGRPMTITRFTNTGTYRTEADRIDNGGHAGVDIQLFGIDMTVTDLTTEFGIALEDHANNSSITGSVVTYHPSDVHVLDAVITDPYADPFVFIEIPNSTVEYSGGTVGTTSPQWDDIRYDWDDDGVTWDGLLLGAAPAFQLDAFQENAFQVALVVHVFATQEMPSFTQHLAVFAGRSVAITQEMPALTQAADVAVQITAPLITQTLAAFTQSADVSLIVSGVIGTLVQVFQDDAFQLDAFQTAPDTAEEMPSFTQHLAGAVVPHGSNIGIIAQDIPSFTQDATGEQSFAGIIAQAIPAFTQAITADFSPFATIAQTMPAFTQAASGGLFISPDAGIHQIIPMFTQHMRTRTERWDEWTVSSGTEWTVDIGEEWLVRT